MKLSRQKTIFLYFVLFMSIGLFITWKTHKTINYTSDSDDVVVDLINTDEYVNQVRLWLNLVINDDSLHNIQTVRQNLMDFKGLEYSLGDTHMNIFLAFDAWERFLLTGDSAYKEQVIKRFLMAEQVRPELKEELYSLKNLIDV